jgi:NRPS condensation-like uncharacterized protein
MLFNSSKSYQYLDKNVPYGETIVITGTVDVEDLKKICAQYDVTITQLIVALNMEASMMLQDIQVKNKKQHRNISISVPMNLRKYYQVPCMRNFSMFVVPSVNPNQTREFEEIITVIKTYMEENLKKEAVDRIIVDNVNLTTNMFIKHVPLFIKDIIVSYVSRTKSRAQFTNVVSNVGLFRLPEEMMAHVEDVNVMVGPARAKKRSCAVVGFNGKLNISFSRNVEDPFIERHVFRRLVEMGARVSIRSNKGEL